MAPTVGTDSSNDREVPAGSAENLPESTRAQPADGGREGSSGRMVFMRFAILLGIPVVSLVFALMARSRRAAVAARGVAAFVLVGLTLLTLLSAGVGFAVAAVLMIAATILATTEPTSGRSA